MGGRAQSDFTENLEAVARGVRKLGEIRDPVLREAVSAALRLRERELRLDPTSRARMRRTVLAALAPRRPTLADRLYSAFAVLGRPAPVLVRALATVALVAGLLGGATVASADTLPDDPLYGLKLAGEQLRLAVAVSPQDRAAVQLSIAQHRLEESERLAAEGRADEAIIATAGYGSSLADAAAELASVEADDPRTAALVAQLEAQLANDRARVGAMAQRLARDPRTAAAAQVLASVTATARPGSLSPAAKVADAAAQVTDRLAAVAEDRAKQAEVARRNDARRTDEPGHSATPRGTEPPRRGADPQLAAAPPATPSPSPTHPVTAPPADPSAARDAAERAKKAADDAKRAAERAKQAAGHSQTPKPTPTRR